MHTQLAHLLSLLPPSQTVCSTLRSLPLLSPMPSDHLPLRLQSPYIAFSSPPLSPKHTQKTKNFSKKLTFLPRKRIGFDTPNNQQQITTTMTNKPSTKTTTTTTPDTKTAAAGRPLDAKSGCFLSLSVPTINSSLSTLTTSNNNASISPLPPEKLLVNTNSSQISALHVNVDDKKQQKNQQIDSKQQTKQQQINTNEHKLYVDTKNMSLCSLPSSHVATDDKKQQKTQQKETKQASKTPNKSPPSTPDGEYPGSPFSPNSDTGVDDDMGDFDFDTFQANDRKAMQRLINMIK
jgi:hypothetical protein